MPFHFRFHFSDYWLHSTVFGCGGAVPERGFTFLDNEFYFGINQQAKQPALNLR
jgi:hypothetical protein